MATASPFLARGFSAGAALARGWRQLWKNFWMLLLAGLVVVAITAAVYFIFSFVVGLGLLGVARTDWSSVNAVEDTFNAVAASTLIGYGVISFLLQFLFVNQLTAGMAYELLLAARGEPVELGGLFRPFTNYWHVSLGLFLPYIVLMAVGAVVALIGFAVPGLVAVFAPVFWLACLFVACKLAFLPFLLVDRRMKAVAAIRASWNMTKGRALKVFVIGLPAIGYFIVLYIVFFVAVFVVASVSYLGDSTAAGFVTYGLAAFVFFVVGGIGAGIMSLWIGTSVAALYDAVAGGSRSVVEEGSPAVTGLMNTNMDSQEPEVS